MFNKVDLNVLNSKKKWYVRLSFIIFNTCLHYVSSLVWLLGLLRDHCWNWLCEQIFLTIQGTYLTCKQKWQEWSMGLARLGIKRHRDLILEFDSLKAFTFISSRVVETHNSWVLLSDIKSLCTRDWMVSFQHTP
jgi:hypothetical protein